MAALFTLDEPGRLLSTHHAGLIVNQESLRQMLGHFTLDQFDPIKVCWVGEGDAQELRIVDGFTRTHAVVHHGETIRARYPDFQLTAINVTAGLLHNPAIADPDALTRPALTTAEYLRALIPPTVVHPEIADRRIAAYIAWAWVHLVGADLAGRYSALAALWFVQGLGWKYDTARHIDPYFIGESAQDRQTIERALTVIAAVLKMALTAHPRGAHRMNIGESLLHLVMAADPALGDESAANGQIYGLLYDPAVTAKFSTTGGEIEGQRATLARLVIQALVQSHRAGDKKYPAKLIESLRDPAWPLVDLLSVLQANDLPIAYTQYALERKERVWREAYREIAHHAPTDTGAHLLHQLALEGQSYTGKEVIPVVIAAETALAKAEEWKTRIEELRVAARQAGVETPELRDWWVAASQVRHVASLPRLHTALDRLKAQLQGASDIAHTIERRIMLSQQITTEFSTELATAQKRAPLLRSQIQQVVEKAEAPQRALRQLRRLDPDLLHATLTHQHSLEAARSLQVQRALPPPPVDAPPVEAPPKNPDKAADEAVRSACRTLVRLLPELDLHTINPQTAIALTDAIQIIGQEYFGVRNLARLVGEEYPALSRRYTRLLEQHTVRQSA